MKARCINFIGDRATVVLTPSLLGRLFGAQPVSIDLERADPSWRTVATGRDLAYVDHGSLIRNALDFREVGSEPRRALIGGTVAL